jgi:hypothetical protein
MPGAFEFDHVQPGTYTVSFTRAGGVPVSSILSLAAGAHRVLNPVLAPAASIFGTVFQANLQPPVPLLGAEVRLYRADQFPSGASRVTTTDSKGFFKFDNVDAPQSYVVVFAFPPGSPGQFSMEIPNLGLSVQDQICSPTTFNCLVNAQ